jgi:pyruvate kinase
LESLPEMHVELMKNGNIRYMSGHFESFEKAVELKNSIRANQVSDAFLTAYENGKRISIADAKIKLGISK